MLSDIMNIKEKFMNKISSYGGEMFSRYYNAAMVEFEYYDNKIWTISTLEEDIEQGYFIPEFHVIEHLITDDFNGNDDFIGESGRGFEDVSYEDAIKNLQDALDQYDDDKIEQVYKWIF